MRLRIESIEALADDREGVKIQHTKGNSFFTICRCQKWIPFHQYDYKLIITLKHARYFFFNHHHHYLFFFIIIPLIHIKIIIILIVIIILTSLSSSPSSFSSIIIIFFFYNTFFSFGLLITRRPYVKYLNAFVFQVSQLNYRHSSTIGNSFRYNASAARKI